MFHVDYRIEMRWFFAIAVLALSPLLATTAGAASGDIIWQDRFDLAGEVDVINDMDIRGQRIVIAVGMGSSSPNSPQDTWIVRAHDVKGGGAIIWSDEFVNPDGKVDLRAVSASGNRVFAVGSRETASGGDNWLVRVYDARKGTLFWDDEVDLGDDKAQANDVFLKGRHGFVVGSTTEASTGLTRWLIRYYDAKAGNLFWEDYPTDAISHAGGATHLAVKGSTLIVGGVAEDGSGNQDWLIRSYKRKDKTLLWSDQIDVDGEDDVLTGISAVGSRVSIAGNVTSAGNQNMRIRTYRAKTGDFQWEATVDSGATDIAAGVAGLGPCVFMAGEADGDFFIRGYATFTGAEMWTDVVDTGGVDRASAITTFGSKSVFAFGRLDSGGGDGDLFGRNYSFHTGEILWETLIDVEGDDEVTGAIAKGSNLFTFGTADRNGNRDWLLYDYKR